MQVSHSFWNVCQQYFSEGILLPLFGIAVLWLIKKWNKRRRTVFFLAAGISILLLYNEITYRLTDLIGEQSTYYRFFWICPFVLPVSYLVIEVYSLAKEKQRSFILIIMCFMVVLFSAQSFDKWFKLPENIYQLDTDVIQVADALMELTGGNQTTLVDNSEISSTIRQYNAKVKITGLNTHDINQILYLENMNYLGREVQEALYLNKSEYAAVRKDTTRGQILERAGAERVAETDNYYLYYMDYDKIEEDMRTIAIVEEELGLYANIEYITIPGLTKQFEFIYTTDSEADEAFLHSQLLIQHGCSEDVMEKLLLELKRLKELSDEKILQYAESINNDSMFHIVRVKGLEEWQ